MEEFKRDLRLEEIINQWYTQWTSIKHPKDRTWFERFIEYQKWRTFLDWWVENIKGRDMNEALEVYKISNKIEENGNKEN